MRTSVRLAVVGLASLAMIPAASVFAQSSAQQVSDDEEDDGDSDRLVCRRSVDTGSLVKGRRTCLTRAQWERQAERQQKAAIDIQEKMRGRPTGE
jgi:hypothetical protein